MHASYAQNLHLYKLIADISFLHWKLAWIAHYTQWRAIRTAFPIFNLMTAVYFDASGTAEERRNRLWSGHILVFSPRHAMQALCGLARQLIEEAFGTDDPQTAQHRMTTQEFANVLAKLKPRFAHHPAIHSHMKAILEEFQCDISKVYYDVPKMRFATSGGYLTKGLGQIWPPHRDTWYSSPLCQVNWWTPIYEIANENAMAFHTQYWGRAIDNDSARYNYYEANRSRRDPNLNDVGKPDPRILPQPTQPVDSEQLRVICPPGGAIMFSGAQLHSSVPNTTGVTRFSFDFRTVHEDDLRLRRGAPNVDGRCKGTSLRDFKRATDQAPLPDDLIEMYDDKSAHQSGDLVFKPS